MRPASVATHTLERWCGFANLPTSAVASRPSESTRAGVSSGASNGNQDRSTSLRIRADDLIPDVEIEAAEVSYAFVVDMAFAGKNDRPATVTFQGSGHGDGELLPGESVRVIDGTFFNVLPK